jgi:hypothetical protein
MKESEKSLVFVDGLKMHFSEKRVIKVNSRVHKRSVDSFREYN